MLAIEHDNVDEIKLEREVIKIHDQCVNSAILIMILLYSLGLGHPYYDAISLIGLIFFAAGLKF